MKSEEEDQAGRIGHAKPLWLGRVWYVQETERVPVWLKHSGEWTEDGRGMKWCWGAERGS